MALAPRVVVVHRRTEYDELLARHGTRGQAEFFLSTRGRSIAEVFDRHCAIERALASVSNAIPLEWRRGTVERADLPRFLFAPDDIVVVVGQDGLVANAAKYLAGQPVVGVNAEPKINPGVLVPCSVASVAPTLHEVAANSAQVEHRTMVEAVVKDGQRLVALNEIYLGHPSHQSSRYRIAVTGGDDERQSSSGILIGSGTGATGWCRSAWQERQSALPLPGATDGALLWFVREAWPSAVTGTSRTEGLLRPREELRVSVETDGLVIFGDGMESDQITLGWGESVSIRAADVSLALVRAS